MIGAQQVVDMVLAEAARLGKADETIVTVTDRQRRRAAVGEQFDDHQRCFGAAQDHGDLGGATRRSRPRGVADVQRGRSVGHPRPGGGVAGGGACGTGSPRQRAAAARDGCGKRLGRTDSRHRRGGLRRRRRSADARLSRAPTGCTDTRGTSWRRRSSPPRAGCGGATPSRPARSRSTPNATVPARGRAPARPTSSMCQPIPCSSELSTRLGWAQRTVELPAGRYETILPPSAVADLMIYLSWSMDGRGAQEGRTALSAPGGGTRVGEKLTDLPLTLYSDPAAAGLECLPFVAVPSSSERGLGVRQRHGHRPGRLDSRRHDQRAGLSAGRRPPSSAFRSPWPRTTC